MDELPARVNRKAETVTLPPRKVKGWVHEMKVSLSDGESLQYETRHGNDANVVAFNIHRHQGKEVTYYTKDARPVISGTFAPPESGDFYLMWENRSDHKVDVTFVVQRIRASR